MLDVTAIQPLLVSKEVWNRGFNDYLARRDDTAIEVATEDDFACVVDILLRNTRGYARASDPYKAPEVVLRNSAREETSRQILTAGTLLWVFGGHPTRGFTNDNFMTVRHWIDGYVLAVEQEERLHWQSKFSPNISVGN